MIQEIAALNTVTVMCGKYHIAWSYIEKVVMRCQIDELDALIFIRHRFIMPISTISIAYL